MPSQNKIPLVAIVGPTAVGKTEIAIQLAQRMNGEIVSADSRLLYRGMDIGTAKPSAADRARVAHHLIDVADPDEICSLALFQEAAQKVIADIHSRGKLPILVGGTGQYLRAILEGWLPPKLAAQPRLRAALEDWAAEIGKDGLHARLGRLDPEAAEGIDPRNLRRTIRALEVIFSTGRKFSEARGRTDSPYRDLQIGLTRPRKELYQRIDRRIEAMLKAGWLDEVKALIDKGYSAGLPSMSAIGYGQLVEHLEGRITLDAAIAQIKHTTRMFVRRQANWFKAKDPEIHWFEAGKAESIVEIEKLVRGFDKNDISQTNVLPEIKRVLDNIADQVQKLLSDNFVGFYIHGSIAMGCFNPLVSDVDFLIVVRNKMSAAEKQNLAQIMLYENYNVPNGIEMSVVLLAYTSNPVFPTPFEFHFSREYEEKYRRDEVDFSTENSDPDLAAHFTVTKMRGIAWRGLPIDDVFSDVPREMYVKSLLHDFKDLEKNIVDRPVYAILNACRTIAYLKDELVISKKEAGEWAFENIDRQYSAIVHQALASYITGEIPVELNEKELDTFVSYAKTKLKEYTE